MKFQDAYEATLASYSKILHPNHHVMVLSPLLAQDQSLWTPACLNHYMQ